MGYYDTALICKNGHEINSMMKEFPEFNTKFCKKCGAEAINACEHCGAEIQGSYSEGFSANYKIPNYCHACGKAYPWTEEKIKALEETVDLMDELTNEEKIEFKKSAKDISTENPRTNLGALKIKKISTKVGSDLWNGAKEIIIQIGTEAALKTMGLK